MWVERIATNGLADRSDNGNNESKRRPRAASEGQGQLASPADAKRSHGTTREASRRLLPASPNRLDLFRMPATSANESCRRGLHSVLSDGAVASPWSLSHRPGSGVISQPFSVVS